MHPAVLELMARTIAAGHAHGKPVSVCGELAGDVSMTRLLLGLGLQFFDAPFTNPGRQTAGVAQ